jgi:membrane protease YdiL (CAAX protease family)
MPLLVPFLSSVILGVLIATVLAMGLAWLWALGRLVERKPLLPEEKNRPTPWNTIAFLIFLLEWLVISFVVERVYYKMSGIRPGPGGLSPAEKMTLGSLVNVALLIVIPASLVWVSRSYSSLRRFGIHREGLGRHARQGAVAFLLMSPVVYAIQYEAAVIWKPIAHPVEEMLVKQPSAGRALFTFFVAVFLAPAVEELVFRGILQSWLSGLLLRSSGRKSVPVVGDGPGDALDGVWQPDDSEGAPAGDPSFERNDSLPGAARASEGEDKEPLAGIEEVDFVERPASRMMKIMPVVLASALFALLHAPQWPAPIAIFLLAMGLGILYQRTGSLVTSFTMHALFNGFSMLMLFAVVLSGAKGETKKPETPARKSQPVTSYVVPEVPGSVSRAGW